MPALLLTNPRAGLGRQRFAFKSATAHTRILLGEQALPDPSRHDLIIVEGGDGTLQRVMTDLLAKTEAQALPPIAVLPAGRTNMSAADINRHHSFRRCAASLTRILEGAAPPATQPRPLVSVQPSPSSRLPADPAESPQPTGGAATTPAQDPPRGQESLTSSTANLAASRKDPPTSGGCRRYAWFFGLGAVCSGIQRWASRRPGSHLGLDLRTAWAVLQEFREPPQQQLISCNGQSRPVLAMMATTLNRLLFGSRPYWGAKPDAQAGCMMHSTWVFAEAQGVLRRSLRLLRGDATLAVLPGFQSGEVTSLHLDFDGLYALDGELFQHSGPLTLSLSDSIRWLPL